jgi:hypothetical protein
MQTTPENEKGRRVTSATTPMQTGADATASDQRQQAPTLTPRHRRILLALLVGQRTREEIDGIAGASNGPDEVMTLRQRFGLVIPCQRKGTKDMDGHPVQVGIYRLTESDRTHAKRLLGGVQ